ncbi:hypothetical protein KAR91_81950 [Candidatus Pacearchaeota archaeon]|nr:hypothetical protein [Candidatus Pacearchaeota archaeon]
MSNIYILKFDIAFLLCMICTGILILVLNVSEYDLVNYLSSIIWNEGYPVHLMMVMIDMISFGFAIYYFYRGCLFNPTHFDRRKYDQGE